MTPTTGTPRTPHGAVATRARRAAFAQPGARLRHLRRLRLVRAFGRFSENGGGLLAAGMSYRALFAVLAGLWLGFAAAGVWLAGNPALMDTLVDTVNRAVPGLVGPGGLVSRQALSRVSVTLGWTGLLALVGMIGTVTSWLGSTRRAVRVMVGAAPEGGNAVVLKLCDVALGFAFGVLLLAAAAVSLVTTTLLSGVFALLGVGTWSPAAVTVTAAAGFLVTVAVNTAVLAVLYRTLGALHGRWRRLMVGALLGGVALAVMSNASGLLLRGAHRNPLAASFVVILGLLVWFDLSSEVILICAAWIAVGPAAAPRGVSADDLQRLRELETRMQVAEAVLRERQAALRTAAWTHRRHARGCAVRAQEQVDGLRRERDRLAATTMGRCPL